jgi:hypothetical protein
MMPPCLKYDAINFTVDHATIQSPPQLTTLVPQQHTALECRSTEQRFMLAYTAVARSITSFFVVHPSSAGNYSLQIGNMLQSEAQKLLAR